METVARAFCITSVVVVETIAATLKIRPVNPLLAWSCSKRLTLPKTDSITSLLPRSRSEGLTFKHSPATGVIVLFPNTE